MFELIGLVMTGAATLGGFEVTRRFVRERLRYVDAVQKPRAAWIAGGAALVAATPVVWALPLVGAGTAMLFGAAVGFGVHRGAKEVRGSRGEIMVV